ncbi:MAG: DNA-directed DNA polymerase II small subunit [Euryarchaeota archaeon]|nr:DNA-directed DNA polymerase II small subunit [Euryarchaeota archaeon]
MKDVFDFLESRGVLLDPMAAAFLETQERPLEFLRESMSGMKDAPLVIALSDLQRLHAPPADASGSMGDLSFPSLFQAPSAAGGGYPGAPRLTPYAGFVAEMSELDRARDTSRGVSSPTLPVAPFTPVFASELPPGVSSDSPMVEVVRDITGQSSCVGELADFKRHFQDRYRSIKAMLRSRPELQGFTTIDRIWQGTGEVKVVGMVSSVRKTKNGHLLIDLDDETGSASVLASQKNPDCIKAAESIVQDEVIGVIGKIFKKDPRDKGLVILNEPNDIIRPDIPLQRVSARSTRNVSAAFISDIHFGSKTFLSREWDRFIEWMNGRHGDERERAKARNVKYLVVSGDVVDGVGVYPRQRNELAITSIMDQYAEAARQFARLPQGVEVIMLPGEHDAVRQAEPQPTFPLKVQKLFRPGVKFVGNPCRFKIEGVSVLAYHGHGLDDYMTSVKGLTYSDPLGAMREMIKRRHLCPVYGGRTPIAPEHKDHLVIESAPDIFVTGHVHSARVGTYRGVTLVNSSTWQDKTDYQKMLGLAPEPARVPIIDLASGQASILDFNYNSSNVAS